MNIVQKFAIGHCDKQVYIMDHIAVFIPLKKINKGIWPAIAVVPVIQHTVKHGAQKAQVRVCKKPTVSTNTEKRRGKKKPNQTKKGWERFEGKV